MLPNLLWEELGFTFVGAVDGHNVAEVEEAFERAKEYIKPTLIHVMTRKGRGYAPAEEDSTKWHGVAPNGSGKRKAPTYTQVFGQTLVREMRENPRVAAVTAAMPDGTGLAAASKEFPNRVFDVGIAEQHAVTFAAGLSTQGILPVVAIYSTFLQRGYDQLIHDVCIQKLPVLFALDRAGIVGDDGKTHQGLFDLSYLRLVPELVVAAPRNENELQSLLHTGIHHMAEAGGPFAIRYPRGSGTGEPMDEEPRLLPLGKGELLRDGDDLAIIAIGNSVKLAVEAAELLDAEGVGCAVVDARFLKPLDEELLLDVAKRCRRVITVEENVLAGGFGSAFVELLASRGIRDVQVELVALPDQFIEHGAPDLLREKYGFTGSSIAGRAMEAFGLRRVSLTGRG